MIQEFCGYFSAQIFDLSEFNFNSINRLFLFAGEYKKTRVQVRGSLSETGRVQATRALFTATSIVARAVDRDVNGKDAELESSINLNQVFIQNDSN